MVMEMPSPQCVGQEFVRQYYTLLHEAPNFMHRFYSHDSSFVHGGIEKPGEEMPPVMGQADIHKKIMSLNFKDCHAKIRQVDSQATIDNAVVVQVVGELSNAGQPMRRFMQTFVLAPQSPKKYYVHNDIFRYQDEVFHDAALENETDAADSGAIDGYEEANDTQGIAVDNGDNHQNQQVLSSSNGGLHVADVTDGCSESVLAQDSEIQQPTKKDSSPASELQSVTISGGAVVEPALDGGVPQLTSGPVIPSTQPSTGIASSGPQSELPAGLQQQQQLAAAPTQTSSTQQQQQQPVEVKAEPAKQVSWAALASKGTSSSTNPAPVKPQATVKPEVKPEAPPVSVPLPQRTPRVDRGSVDRESSSGGVGGSGVSGGEGEEFARRSRYPDNLQVFVGNLPHNFFRNRTEGSTSKNFGFVVFENVETVQKVLNARPLFIFDDKYRLNVEEKKQQSDYRPGGGVPRGSPRGGFRGGFNSARGSGGRGVWRGGRGGRGGSGYGSGRSGDDDAAGDDRNYERPQ